MVTQLARGERKMMNKKAFILPLLLGMTVLLAACSKPAEPTEPASSDTKATTTAVAEKPPAADAVEIFRPGDDVPPAINRPGGQKVVMTLETKELNGFIAKDTTYNFWTYGGKLPGPFLRAKVGDTIELHLKNDKSSKFPHSVDMHAVTGQGGGGGVSQTNPGQESVATFKALQPGLFLYHCATPDIAQHMANGMSGLILIEPNGLPKVDKEFYIMQYDMYAKGGKTGHLDYDVETHDVEHPRFVTFNGKFLGLTGDNTMKAKVGDKVRIYVGAGLMQSNFHVIGEIFDAVHHEGASEASHNVQTTVIPAGGAAWVEFKIDVPGTYILVDHALTRSLHKGAVATIVAEGKDNPEIYKSVKSGSSAPATE